jgi:hypothetical protein
LLRAPTPSRPAKEAARRAMEGTVLCAANHALLTPISFLERTALV